MNTTPQVQEASRKIPSSTRRPSWWLLLATAVLLLGFGSTLYDLTRFALRTDLFSHILLIPFVTGYLIWLKRDTPMVASAPDRRWAAGLLAAGSAILIWYYAVVNGRVGLVDQDRLAFKVLAFVLLFNGVAAAYVGRAAFRTIAFPLAFLVFMTPLPVAWVHSIEYFLQHQSAAAAAVLFKTYGTPFFREETYFQLPGINLEVAPECSGIRSSLALFITSIVAGYMFLRSPFKRGLLAIAVIPLAIVRNAFRVFVIGELCVHVGPAMIDSPIHHRGGPIFFALSLIPFFFLLWLLLKLERRPRSAAGATPDSV